MSSAVYVPPVFSAAGVTETLPGSVMNTTFCPVIRLSLASFRISFSTDLSAPSATMVSGVAVSSDLPLSGFVLSAVSVTVVPATLNALPFRVTVICASPDLVPFSVAV